MTVIVPTRGRPHNAARLIEAWQATEASAPLLFVVDETDEKIEDYAKLLRDSPEFVSWIRTPTKTMVAALNYGARKIASSTRVGRWIGFMGDDHVPRTPRWDERISATFLRFGPSIVYANDTVQGQNLPTQAFIARDFIFSRGRMCPQTLTHLYVDNYWKRLGELSETLVYLADVIIEHVHPVAGKAEWDEGYRRVNDGSIYGADHGAFNDYMASSEMTNDVERMRELRQNWGGS